MAFEDDLRDTHLLDPDALLVINEIWEELDTGWKRAIRSECEAGEDLWAMELALQAAVEIQHTLSTRALKTATSVANELGGDFSILVNNSLRSLKTEA